MGKISVYNKIVMKTRKRENMQIKKFIHKSSSKGRFGNGIYSWLKRADARGSAETIYSV